MKKIHRLMQDLEDRMNQKIEKAKSLKNLISKMLIWSKVTTLTQISIFEMSEIWTRTIRIVIDVLISYFNKEKFNLFSIILTGQL